MSEISEVNVKKAFANNQVLKELTYQWKTISNPKIFKGWKSEKTRWLELKYKPLASDAVR